MLSKNTALRILVFGIVGLGAGFVTALAAVFAAMAFLDDANRYLEPHVAGSAANVAFWPILLFTTWILELWYSTGHPDKEPAPTPLLWLGAILVGIMVSAWARELYVLLNLKTLSGLGLGPTALATRVRGMELRANPAAFGLCVLVTVALGLLWTSSRRRHE